MRKLVGVLATALILTVIAGALSSANAETPAVNKKYGIELAIGGGFHVMQDVNDFIPDPGFIGTPDKINIGTQFGFGISYRHMHNFGWQFGYNRFIMGLPPILEQKYRNETYFTSTLSWAEQTVSGWELYALPTWYWPWKNKELMLSVGPAIYGANVDRSISIVRTAGSQPNAAGSFNDAGGTSLGAVLSVGIEIPFKGSNFLLIQGGGRLAPVAEIKYEDVSEVEQIVLKNTGTNAKFGVDFSGAFIKVSLRSYFKPATTDWRTPMN